MPEKSKIPVAVITGFLGSGKTTLLNHILSDPNHGLRIAVIENEFGEVGVDDSLLRTEKLFGVEKIIEMSNGCICCTARGDLIEILLNLKTQKIDLILIETTGLADPGPVIQTFYVHEEIKNLFVLDSIVTVVDAKHLLMHLDDKSKAEGVENESAEQIAFADLILLNKLDLVQNRQEIDYLRSRILGINKAVEIVETVQSKIDPNLLFLRNSFSLTRVLDMDPNFFEEDDHMCDKTVSSVGFVFSYDLDHAKLQNMISRLLEEKGADLFRYKGIVPIKGMKKRFVFQGVHMIFGGSYMNEWGEDEPREGRFIFIGRNLDRESLTTAFEACRAVPLRFNVGDLVRVRLDRGFRKGVIRKIWDQGNAYRVHIRPLRMDVWAAQDTDKYIRAI